ncbi:MAG: CapA family protein [Cyanobacteria bacterium P01_H01_bin.119]
MIDGSNDLELQTLAQQGDPSAIAKLIRRTLGFEPEIVVSAQYGANVEPELKLPTELHILLQAPYVPEQARYAHQIYAAVLCLEATYIQNLQITGQSLAVPQPAWQQQWPLDYSVLRLKASLTEQSSPVPAVSPAIALENLSEELAAEDSTVNSAPSPAIAPAPRSSPDRTPKTPYLSLKQLSLVALAAFSVGLVSVLGASMLRNGGGRSAQAPNPASTQSDDSAQSDAPTLSFWQRLGFGRSRQAPQAEQPAQPSSVPGPEAQPETEASIAPPALTIKAVGDIIPGTDYPNWRMPGDPNYLFNSIRPFLIKETDIVFGNFESTLTDFPNSAKDISRGMTFAFRTPPAYADVLTSAGFDVLSVANNHSFDFGQPGFDDTIANIENAGMQAVGRKGQITYVDAKGLRTAFIAFSYFDYHNSMHDLPAAQALIDQANQEADIVVISVHAGAEGTAAQQVRDRTEYFYGENRGNLVTFSRAVIDYGADLVLGHGSHVPRAIELYKDKLIAYSLGNFLGHETLSVSGALGNSMILQVGLDPDGNFVNGRVIPVALDPNGVPYLDDYFQSVILVRKLTRQDFPQTPLVIDDMGYILRDSFTQ